MFDRKRRYPQKVPSSIDRSILKIPKAMMLDFQTALLPKKQFLLSELQTHGLRLVDASVGASSRMGGAGPTDHKAVTVLGTTIMVPVHTRAAARSPYIAAPPNARGTSVLLEDGRLVCEISFPPQPK